MTIASAPFFRSPPKDFHAPPILRRRGILWVAREEQKKLLDAFYDTARRYDPTVTACTLEDALRLCPILDPACIAHAVLEPDACDIDVHALHQGYINAFKHRGGSLLTNARVTEVSRSGSLWNIGLSDRRYECAIVVNAAGAWADEIASLAGITPIGLTSKRRTAITFNSPTGVDARDWPCILDVEEEFYLKPDAGRLMASPGDETPTAPSDVQPEEIDIAVCVDRVERATTFGIRKIVSKWAGLRTFAADKIPVIGFAPSAEGFFWLAGQGGYGIMTSPAISDLASSLIAGQVPSQGLGAWINATSPNRL